MKKDFVEITCPVWGPDAAMFASVIDQGIDSHLEAFTKSKFAFKDVPVFGGFYQKRYVYNFHIDELKLLVRRLEELGTEDGDSWADNIRDLEEFPK